MFSCGKSMKQAMHATIYTEEMAQTTVIAKTLGTYEPMSKEAEKAMQDLIAADQAASCRMAGEILSSCLWSKSFSFITDRLGLLYISAFFLR